jgi:hypothetical protein
MTLQQARIRRVAALGCHLVTRRTVDRVASNKGPSLGEYDAFATFVRPRFTCVGYHLGKAAETVFMRHNGTKPFGGDVPFWIVSS